MYVIKNQGIGECLLSLNGVKPYKHEWKINEFTKLKSYVYSEEFTVEGYKWYIVLAFVFLYPCASYMLLFG